MYRYNTKAKIPQNNEQTSEQRRIGMKIGNAWGRVLMGGGG
jgi:hypothetical protein